MHGLQGDVIVYPLTDDPDRFFNLDKVLLEGDGLQQLEISSARRHKNQILLRFKGVSSRSEAENLVGCYLSVTETDLAGLPEDSYYHFELIGMKVYTEEEQYLGEVTEILTMPANDVWRVSGEREFLLPATANVVLAVDRAAGKITVKLLDGLIGQ